MRHNTFPEGYHGPLRKSLCPSNWPQQQVPLPTAVLYGFQGWLTSPSSPSRREGPPRLQQCSHLVPSQLRPPDFVLGMWVAAASDHIQSPPPPPPPASAWLLRRLSACKQAVPMVTLCTSKRPYLAVCSQSAASLQPDTDPGPYLIHTLDGLEAKPKLLMSLNVIQA